MTRQQEPRRHADGAIDIGHYRRRARRLRSIARRQAWVSLRQRMAALWRWLKPRGIGGPVAARLLAALLCVGAAAAAAEPAPGGFTASPLLAARLDASPWWMFRMSRVALGRGAEMARAMPLGDEIVLVAEGSIVVEIEGRSPRVLRSGEAFQYRPMAPHVTRNASASEPALLILVSVSGVGLPSALPVGGFD